MLRPRGPVEQDGPAPPDPVFALNVGLLATIAAALFAAGILAVYTYSTPAVEVPLVVAIALAFSLLLVVNLLRLGIRQLL